MCYESCDIKKEKSMISPCCGRVFHKKCVQKMALSAGEQLSKCPLCGDEKKKEFNKEVENIGVYLPNKDPDWETDESFYQHNTNQAVHRECNAKICYSNKGTKYSVSIAANR